MRGIRFPYMSLNLISLNNNIDSLLSCDVDLRQVSVLTLSFIGDSVYDLMVREYIISLANRPVGQLNLRKVSVVNCKFQSECLAVIEPTQMYTVYLKMPIRTTITPQQALRLF